MSTLVVLGDSGIVLGDTDSQGVEWQLSGDSDLWQPKPSPRHVTGDRTVGHGSWDATEFYGDRTQQFELHVRGPSHEALHEAKDRLFAAVGIRPFRVVGIEPNHPAGRWSLMRQDGQMPWSEQTPGTDRGGAIATTSIALVARDPLLYANDIRTVTTGAPSSTGGLSWPTAWPATWDAQVTTGVIRLTNGGNMSAPVEWRIDGPATDPMVTEALTGRRWRLALALEPGEWVTVDSQTMRVLALGDPQASRRPQWSGDWLHIPPGGATYAFSATETNEQTRLTATWRPTWI